MLKIEKLSEKNLGEVVTALFPNHKSLTSQKRFRDSNRTFVVDYFLEVGDDKIVFEFDGPTHFTDSKTQQRDIYLEVYCHVNNYVLVRVPYFIQIDDDSLPALFPEEIIVRHKLFATINDIVCVYKTGFHDPKIIYPGNFNLRGWEIFWKLYCHFNVVDRMSVMRDIYHSLEGIDDNISMGIGWHKHEEKRIFIESYPT